MSYPKVSSTGEHYIELLTTRAPESIATHQDSTILPLYVPLNVSHEENDDLFSTDGKPTSSPDLRLSPVVDPSASSPTLERPLTPGNSIHDFDESFELLYPETPPSAPSPENSHPHVFAARRASSRIAAQARIPPHHVPPKPKPKPNGATPPAVAPYFPPAPVVAETQPAVALASSPSPSPPPRRTRGRPIVPVPNLTKKSRGRKVPVVAQPAERHSQTKNPRAGSPRLHVCQVEGCAKCFKRREHLKRHVVSIHTYEKPFECDAEGCDKRFTRHDNLLQHQRVHRLQ